MNFSESVTIPAAQNVLGSAGISIATWAIASASGAGDPASIAILFGSISFGVSSALRAFPIKIPARAAGPPAPSLDSDLVAIAQKMLKGYFAAEIAAARKEDAAEAKALRDQYSMRFAAVSRRGVATRAEWDSITAVMVRAGILNKTKRKVIAEDYRAAMAAFLDAYQRSNSARMHGERLLPQ